MKSGPCGAVANIARSRSPHARDRGLIRTVSCWRTPCRSARNAATFSRAASLSPSATASSKSRISPWAPVAPAFTNRSGPRPRGEQKAAGQTRSFRAARANGRDHVLGLTLLGPDLGAVARGSPQTCSGAPSKAGCWPRKSKPVMGASRLRCGQARSAGSPAAGRGRPARDTPLRPSHRGGRSGCGGRSWSAPSSGTAARDRVWTVSAQALPERRAATGIGRLPAAGSR